jgi:hypothetical protein
MIVHLFFVLGVDANSKFCYLLVDERTVLV